MHSMHRVRHHSAAVPSLTPFPPHTGAVKKAGPFLWLAVWPVGAAEGTGEESESESQCLHIFLEDERFLAPRMHRALLRYHSTD